MTTAETPHVEIISPEGVEERLIEELIVRITLTGGGRYRVYAEMSRGREAKPAPIDVKDTLAEAHKSVGSGLAMMALGYTNPAKLIEIWLKDQSGKKT